MWMIERGKGHSRLQDRHGVERIEGGSYVKRWDWSGLESTVGKLKRLIDTARSVVAGGI
jgi:hypothetical protein